MKFLLSILLALLVVVSSAFEFTAKKVKRQKLRTRASSYSASNLRTTVNTSTNAQDGLDLSSIHDLIYLANITVGGLNYSVQLDTGSSDLFIKGDTYPIPNTNETSLTLNLTYALGWADGYIAYASVQFLDIFVPSQAFVDAKTVDNPAMSYGANGVAGLGFTRLSSVDSLINSTRQSTGRSLLYNLFMSNPSESNFIAFSFDRNGDPGSDVQGVFSIGEVEPQFANVSNNLPIPTYPDENPSRWSVLIDAVIVNDTITVPTSSVAGAPSNKAVALIDSGCSYSYVSKEICDALYSNIPGAMFDTPSGYWTVPCDAEVDMALQIGGQVIPLHPLDVTPTTALDPSVCIGSFVPLAVAVGNDIDWLIGDNFLRSVYSVYDFGDFDASGNMVNPYLKFLSLVIPDQASVDFHNVRGGTPNQNITYTGLSEAALQTSQSLGMIVKFIPPMFALVALNSLVLIICCVVWLVSFCRKRRVRAIARIPRSRSSMRPMPLNDTSSYIAEATTPSPSTPLHTYEPVSMALTEDTFVPPTPAFYNSEGRKMQRPKSFS